MVMSTVGKCNGDNDSSFNVTAVELTVLVTANIGDCSSGDCENGGNGSNSNGRKSQQG